MMLGGIYQIKNTINNKIYIGSAKNIDIRIKDHKCRLNNNKHINKKLQNAWNKYGPQGFIFEVLEVVTRFEDLIMREQTYLDCLVYASSNDSRFHNLSYNICRKAGSRLGIKEDEETKIKRSKIQKDVMARDSTKEKIRTTNLTKETKDRRSKASQGRIPNKRTREKMSTSRKKYLSEIGKYSIETRKKMSDAKIGKDAHNRIKISQYTLDLIFIKDYNSIEEAVKSLQDIGIKVHSSKISLCINGKRNKAANYIWKKL